MSSPEPKSFFSSEENSPAKTALFISGSGTNAEKILEHWQASKTELAYEPVCLVTDRPSRCRAGILSEKFGIKLISLDIFEFYRERGLSTISLASEKGRQVREEWTTTLYELLKPFEIDFGTFAGFVPLSNITKYFPCLNVHPGDLTVVDESGGRLLVGLHTLPVHLAFQAGFDSMRSSVIVACAYEEEGAGMDNGHVLGVSEEVKIDLLGKDRAYFEALFSQRSETKPKGGWQDEYQLFLEKNQEKLKIHGDWVAFPKVLADFAAGKFAYKREQLFYKSAKNWLPVELIEYSVAGKEIVFNSN